MNLSSSLFLRINWTSFKIFVESGSKTFKTVPWSSHGSLDFESKYSIPKSFVSFLKWLYGSNCSTLRHLENSYISRQSFQRLNLNRTRFQEYYVLFDQSYSNFHASAVRYCLRGWFPLTFLLIFDLEGPKTTNQHMSYF